jgi:hypothetical protein
MDTDYLVVGAGAGGMAFTDALLAASERTVTIVDRRHAPGGHWLDAYPFVRLHTPSAFYGVSSLPLGQDKVETLGLNRGVYEMASAAEICAYYERVMHDMLASGRVRYFPLSDYEQAADGSHQIVSRVTGERRAVKVANKLVDATYLETSVPATHTRNFEVEPGVRCVPVAAISRIELPSARYVVMGAGKTAVDACLHLLALGVPTSRIRWLKPREAWLLDRRYNQPLEQVASIYEGLAAQAEAAAGAQSVAELFERLEQSGQILRVDPSVEPTMYRCATVSSAELEQLRSVTDVVRLGRVLRIERERIVMQQGSVEASADDLYIDCTAIAFTARPVRPIFEADRITLQALRTCQPCFNSALIGHLEATRDDIAQKNQLCPPNPYPTRPEEWIRMFVVSNMAQFAWTMDPAIASWMEGTRLNASRGSKARRHEPALRAALDRLKQSMGPAIQNLTRLQQPT